MLNVIKLDVSLSAKSGWVVVGKGSVQGNEIKSLAIIEEPLISNLTIFNKSASRLLSPLIEYNEICNIINKINNLPDNGSRRKADGSVKKAFNP